MQFWRTLALSATALTMLASGVAGCAEKPPPAPAEFKVTSLDIEPTEVVAGETVSITAVVGNTGGSEGTYAAVLTVDGATVETKEVTIAAGASKTVTFSLVKDDAGTYEIGVGELSVSLVVKEELVIEEFELKYDDGMPESYQAIGRMSGNGYLVHFSPPATPFTITKVKIYGNLYGTGYESLEFTVEIWDEDPKEIHSASYPHTEFSLSPGWVEIDIPNVVVSGAFYIHVFTHSPPEGGIQVGYDSSVENEHSDMTRDYQIVWWSQLPKETVNWMIRVIGSAATSPSAAPDLPFGELVRVEPEPQKGFYWAYYLYVPGSVRALVGESKRTYLLVEPNNTGHASDDQSIHDAAAASLATWRSELAEDLRAPLLVPTFPRPQQNWQIYTHALDRDTILTDIEELKRIDLQLISMIDDAIERLSSQGILLEEKVLMMGFSASGMFVNRFVVLHPEVVQAAAVGSPGGWPIAPLEEWNRIELRYPVGVWDIEELAGKEFDIQSFKSVPLYFYMGDKDTNDSVPFRDGYEQEDEQLIFQYLGDTLVERWPIAEEIYNSIGCSSQFVLYPGVGHSITIEMLADIKTFFLTQTPESQVPSLSDYLGPNARELYTFEQIVPLLDTPDKVSMFMKNNIKWDGDYDNRVCGGNQYDPAWIVYQHGIDDCDGHAILQAYILERNGWDAYVIGLSIEGGGPGHDVCGINTEGRILVLDNEGQIVGPFDSLADVARHYIAKGWMWNGGSLRTIRASQITQVTTGYSTPKVTDLPWTFHKY